MHDILIHQDGRTHHLNESTCSLSPIINRTKDEHKETKVRYGQPTQTTQSTFVLWRFHPLVQVRLVSVGIPGDKMSRRLTIYVNRTVVAR
jgi:hypothetical protein